MSNQARRSYFSYLSIPTPARARPWFFRRSGPGLLLGGLVAGLLGLCLLALAGLAGLIAGLQSVPPRPLESTSTRPTALLLVLPGVPSSSETDMPAPDELATVAAAPLPAVEPSAPPVVEPEPASQRPEKSIITYADLFRSVGEQTGIDWRLLAALAYRESRMDPLALGPDGDMGLMQILPTTWDEFAPGVAAHNPFDPRENVQVAAAYLVYLQDFVSQQGTNDLRWVLVSYNWGPDNIRRLFAGGGQWEDLPALQRRYVADILHAALGAEQSE